MAVQGTNTNLLLNNKIDAFKSKQMTSIESRINNINNVDTLGLDVDELNNQNDTPIKDTEYDDYVSTTKKSCEVLRGMYNYTLKGNKNFEGLYKLHDGVSDLVNKLEKDPNNQELLDQIKKYSSYGVTDYESLAVFKQYLEENIVDIKISDKDVEKKEKIAQYDGLENDKEYKNYELKYTQEDFDSIEKDSNMKEKEVGEDEEGRFIGLNFDYREYQKKHPDISQVEFIMMLNEKYPNTRFSVNGIGLVDEIKDLIEAQDEDPNVLKMYAYYREKGADEFNKYKKDNIDDINDLRGKVQAKRIVEELESAKTDDEKAAILNKIKVGTYSIEQASYEWSMNYAEHVFNFLDWINPNWNLGGEKSVADYKYEYLIMALSDLETKEELGLIKKDENGNYINTNPNSIINYKEDLAGNNLDETYNFSKIIWKLIPTLAMGKATGDTKLNVFGKDVTLANILTSISSGGDKTRELRLKGKSAEEATVGGLYKSFTDLLTNKYLSGVKFLGDVEINSLSDYIKAALKEGGKSSIKNVVDSIFEWSFLGIEPPKTPEEWIEFGKKTGNKGIQGIILALIGNAGYNSEKTELGKPTKEVAKKVVSEQTKTFKDTMDSAHEIKEGVIDGFNSYKMGMEETHGILKDITEKFTKNNKRDTSRLLEYAVKRTIVSAPTIFITEANKNS